MPARLTFKLDARDKEQGVPFDAFAEMAGHVASMLAELDAAATGEPTMRWMIRGLRYGSAEVEIEAVPTNPLLDRGSLVVSQFSTGMAVVRERNERPAWFSDDAWEDARGVVRVLHDGIEMVTFGVGDETLILTGAIHLPEEVEAVLEVPTEIGAQTALSTIEGPLEDVYGRDKQRPSFALWDALSGRRVTCDFPPRMWDDVRRGLQERVRVHGLVQFDRLGRPTRVQVRSINVLAHDKKRPRATDLRGLAPGLTGGVPSDEWVRRIRDA